uniref:(northern house mosquito) hypothetical protein n=1 Tax=Culex pipiens TaxID=7175 RepID=A0A8D8ASQ1_CULPI
MTASSGFVPAPISPGHGSSPARFKCRCCRRAPMVGLVQPGMGTVRSTGTAGRSSLVSQNVRLVTGEGDAIDVRFLDKREELIFGSAWYELASGLSCCSAETP